jgi:3-methylcrotonyl-CoA carboxylase alpha subunit
MFEKILIANRGEIACRVMRTAKRLGIRTVAVYSDADAQSMHVAMADEAYCIGPAPARESYLRGDAILDAAKKSGAAAIHPGYGFLSENAEFALACESAGVVFIGPPVAAIRIMGSKSESKRLMEKAGVPLVPGYHGGDQSDQAIAKAAKSIGFPALIKASAGGGGKGMRIVRNEAELADAIQGARREAKASFGDDSLLVEKYLDHPRHVEIQVFADTKGNVVHLFERDCSLQRRHQKVIEEAPAPGLDAKLRARMGEAAVKAAAAVNYVGAGTVEFLKDGDHFYFIEMNTRLQVEHPVTEMITGQDLVAWQLAVASGEPLPVRQEDLVIKGHAFEARVYAEDPARDFLPAIGRLKHLRPPAEGPHVRVDTGVRAGDDVQVHYDPMIAKLICWDIDRSSALRRLRTALAEYQVVGVATNLGFLGAVAEHPAFAAGAVDTGFFERHKEALFPEAKPISETVLALAALDVLLRRSEEVSAQAERSADPYSPWHSASGWRLNDDNHHDLTFKDGERLIDIAVHYRPGGRWVLDLPSGPMPASCEREENGDLAADLGGVRLRATVVHHGGEAVIIESGRAHRLVLHDRAALGVDHDAAGGSLVAPMPGRVTQVMVKPGDKVERGQTLLVIEAMKMEHSIRAPAGGTVTKVNFAVGDQASDGDALIAFEAEEA